MDGAGERANDVDCAAVISSPALSISQFSTTLWYLVAAIIGFVGSESAMFFMRKYQKTGH